MHSSCSRASVTTTPSSCYDTSVEVTVHVDILAAAESSHLEQDDDLGYAFNDNGTLPFELPRLQAFAALYAVPKFLNPSATCSLKNLTLPLGLTPYKLGEAAFVATNNTNNTYIATFGIPFTEFIALKVLHPDTPSGYTLFVDVTNDIM